jgi:hypothetical protein
VAAQVEQQLPQGTFVVAGSPPGHRVLADQSRDGEAKALLAGGAGRGGGTAGLAEGGTAEAAGGDQKPVEWQHRRCAAAARVPRGRR